MQEKVDTIYWLKCASNTIKTNTKVNLPWAGLTLFCGYSKETTSQKITKTLTKKTQKIALTLPFRMFARMMDLECRITWMVESFSKGVFVLLVRKYAIIWRERECTKSTCVNTSSCEWFSIFGQENSINSKRLMRSFDIWAAENQKQSSNDKNGISSIGTWLSCSLFSETPKHDWTNTNLDERDGKRHT